MLKFDMSTTTTTSTSTSTTTLTTTGSTVAMAIMAMTTAATTTTTTTTTGAQDGKDSPPTPLLQAAAHRVGNETMNSRDGNQDTMMVTTTTQRG